MTSHLEMSEHGSIPMFNKHSFSSTGSVVITTAARMVMAKNGNYMKAQSGDTHSSFDSVETHQLTTAELHSMRCVVDGLRLIHRDQSLVKEVLSHCVTLERYEPNEYVTKKNHEQQLSCHFILSGSVKVIYEMQKEDTTPTINGEMTEDLPKHQDPTETEVTNNTSDDNIILYRHGAGEYLAMLSLEDIDDGIAPPAKICTLEPTELLRVDTREFYQRLERLTSCLRDEIKSVIQNPKCVLSAVPEEAVQRILPHISRQHYPSHREVIKQGDQSSVMFCLAAGRCDITRTVHVAEAKRDVNFNLGSVQQYDIFGHECLLKSSPSTCTVTTTTPCLVLKINRLALEVVIKDHLFGILDKDFAGYPSDEELKKIGYQACIWNGFKHSQIKQHLTEVGAQRLLHRRFSDNVRRKSMTHRENYTENLRRFILKGANFEPVTNRIRSAYIRRPTQMPPDHNITSDNTNNCVHGGYKRNRNIGDTRRVKSAGPVRGVGATTEKITDVYIGEAQGSSCDSRNNGNNDPDTISSSSALVDAKRDTENTQNKEDDREPNHKLKHDDSIRQHTWKATLKSSDTRYNSNFMRAAVMVTLKTNQIVKQAKAVVKKSRLQAAASSKKINDSEDRWYTSIHQEHDRLTREITIDKERMLQIRQDVDERAKLKRESNKNKQIDADHKSNVSTRMRTNNCDCVVSRSKPIQVSEYDNHDNDSKDLNSNILESNSENIKDNYTSADDGSISFVPLVAPTESRLKSSNKLFTQTRTSPLEQNKSSRIHGEINSNASTLHLVSSDNDVEETRQPSHKVTLRHNSSSRDELQRNGVSNGAEQFHLLKSSKSSDKSQLEINYNVSCGESISSTKTFNKRRGNKVCEKIGSGNKSETIHTPSDFSISGSTHTRNGVRPPSKGIQMRPVSAPARNKYLHKKLML